MKQIRFILTLLLLVVAWPLVAQGDLVTIRGVVRDSQSGRVLQNVNLTIPASNIGTVSNSEGGFSLKVSAEALRGGIACSHLGYRNAYLSLDELKKNNYHVVAWMVPISVRVDEVAVYGGKARDIMLEAVSRIADNYPDHQSLYSAFYRETIQKRRNYIGISEAVMSLYKSPYTHREIYRDRVRMERGRRLVSQSVRDTVAVKIAGGPSLAIALDLVKNENEMLNAATLDFYDFELEEPVMLDSRMHFVVRARPLIQLDYALLKGRFYIDQERMSFTRAELELDLSDRDKAIAAVLRQRPAGLKVKLNEVSFIISYRNQGDFTFLNYIRSTFRFKCDWRRLLFSSPFTAVSEMVMVDRDDNAQRIEHKEAFRSSHIFYDVVDERWEEDYWQQYNIIEPTESLEEAVDKLRRRNQALQ